MPEYKCNIVSEIILGKHYRKEWITPVKVPYIDYKKVYGGLIPVEQGGGKQTLSIKLKDTSGAEYTLKSIVKYPSKALPPEMRGTFLEDLVTDQVSAQHPYGALAVPVIAEAVHAKHSNPSLVAVAPDEALQKINKSFSNILAILEENASGDQHGIASFGNPDKIISTEKVLKKINENHSNKIDVKAFARCRLLDMYLGDWDRHWKQYKWGVHAHGKEKTYMPIPEDRDQVFFYFDGVLPWLASRKWSIRNLQTFNYSYQDVKGLNLTANPMDRRLLSSLSTDEWVAIADSMQHEITDSVIQHAIAQFPPEVQSLEAPEIIKKLKYRRDHLVPLAKEYANSLNTYVDVYGSAKKENFLITRHDGYVEVMSIKMKDSVAKDTLFKRAFYGHTTKEIRLYGQGGNDIYILQGSGRKIPKIRIVGGPDFDSIVDHDTSKKLFHKKKLFIYDSKAGNYIAKSQQTALNLSNDTSVHNPASDQFKYNVVSPVISFFTNKDDGLFLGGGAVYKKYAFRKKPYAQEHKFAAYFSTSTYSKKLEYHNYYRNVFSGFDLETTIKGYAPAFVMNYFGYGNESKLPQDRTAIKDYRILLTQVIAHPALIKNMGKWSLGVGPKYEFFKINNPSPSGNLPSKENDPQLYQAYHYAGLRAHVAWGKVDNTVQPSKGIIWQAEANFNKRLKVPTSYTQVTSELKFYYTPNIPLKITIASRTGVASNAGSFEFFQANMIGAGNMVGTFQNLRGYRKTRFIGDQSFYENLEARLTLLKFKAYLFPGKAGILLLTDHGRVWSKGEASTLWHRAYGAGAWVNIFDKLVVTGTWSSSEEDTLFNLRTGFSF